MSRTYHVSPRLRFDYPWVNRPDTAYNADGLFHVDGVGKGPQVDKMKGLIDGAVEKAFAEHVAELKPAEAKKWTKYLPYEAVTDDAGNETGDTKFAFKQNAKIKLTDGSVKDVTIEIRDSQDQVVDVNVFGGTEGRIMYTMRPIVMTSARQVGIRLDFFKVQIIKLKSRTGTGFGAVEDDDAYVAATEQAGFGNGDAADEEQGGEY